MTLRLEVFPDVLWAENTARRFELFLAGHPRARVCLPTGDTVAPFYREVGRRVSLDAVTIFLLDEFGGLPRDDPGRCESMIRRHLIDVVDGEPELMVPDVDADEPAVEAGRYQRAIEGGGLDLAILGLGSNGHVGMNEPGSSRDSPTRVVSLATSTTDHAQESYGATVAPEWGITVGLGQLLAAREVWLMVTGEHKAKILEKTMTSPIGSEVPATILREHHHATVLADESAAVLL